VFNELDRLADLMKLDEQTKSRYLVKYDSDICDKYSHSVRNNVTK